MAKNEIDGLKQAARALRKRARKHRKEVKQLAGAVAENMKILAEQPDNKELRKMVQKQFAELETLLAGPNIVPFKRA